MSNTAAAEKKTIQTTIRMDKWTKALIDTASMYANLSQSDFILSAARKQAEELITERKETLSNIAPMVLDEVDSEWFFQMLERDFVPNKAMLEMNKKRRRDIIVRI